MAMLESWQSLVGAWSGTSRLFLPDDPVRESQTTATVGTVAQGKFCSVSYTWEYEGEAQDGLLLLGSEQDAVEMVFVDSWHMGDKMMVLRGQAAAEGATSVLGSYSVGDSPEWGWRIVVEPGDDSWRLLMYNVLPTGEEFLGVEAEYTRAG
jgi:hypothetical protein